MYCRVRCFVIVLLITLEDGYADNKAWDVQSALHAHQKTKQADLLTDIKHGKASQRTNVTLIAVSAHNAVTADLLAFLETMIQSVKTAGLTRSHDIVLFFSGDTSLGSAVAGVAEAISKKGLGELNIVKMRSPPPAFVTPIEIFTDTYIAQEAVMNWRLNRPQYAFAWIIEQDVRYSGEWGIFFSKYGLSSSGADIICYVRPNQEKTHWLKCTYCTEEDKKAEMATFLPVVRYSTKAHATMRKILLAGKTGQHEFFVYAVAKHEGLVLQPFEKDEVIGRNYGAGCYWSTDRYKAELHDKEGRKRFDGKLYHPVKAEMAYTEVCFWERPNKENDFNMLKFFYRGSGLKVWDEENEKPLPIPAKIKQIFALNAVTWVEQNITWPR